MNTNEMDPHVSYLAFAGDTPMRILKDATGQIFTFEWVSLGYKVDGKTVSAMIPVPLSKDGELGDEYRIERKWRNKDTFDYPVASGKTTLSMPQAVEHIVKYQMAAAGAL